MAGEKLTLPGSRTPVTQLSPGRLGDGDVAPLSGLIRAQAVTSNILRAWEAGR